MMRDVFRNSGKLIYSFLPVACMVLYSYGAVADPIPGCDPVVLKAMNAKAQAQVAVDVAYTSQLFPQPESTPALTCLNQAAGVSAQKGGEIFSGEFVDDLTPLITNALEDLYSNFINADGFESGVVDYVTVDATKLDPNYKCEEMDHFWEWFTTKGVDDQVPWVTFDEMVKGTPPADAGDDMKAEWEAAAGQNVFTDLSNAMAAIPPPVVNDFSTATSACAVLEAAGITCVP